MRHLPDHPLSRPRPSLRDLASAPSGHVQMLRCGACSHLAPLPAAALLRRFGAECAAVPALRSVVCTACQARGNAQAVLLRLCDPGCGRNRG